MRRHAQWHKFEKTPAAFFLSFRTFGAPKACSPIEFALTLMYNSVKSGDIRSIIVL